MIVQQPVLQQPGCLFQSGTGRRKKQLTASAAPPGQTNLHGSQGSRTLQRTSSISDAAITHASRRIPKQETALPRREREKKNLRTVVLQYFSV